MTAHGFSIALQFLTRLPAPRLAHYDGHALARACRYFPLIGALIGAVVAAALWSGAHLNPWMGALAGLVAWVWVTGGMHLDGLGDVADALAAAHRSPERLQEVLADPHAGSFAVIAISLQIAAKLMLLGSLPAGAALAGLVLVPAWARWGTLVWSRALPPLKTGLAHSFASGQHAWTIVAWGAALIGASLWAAPALLSALAVVALLAAYWRRRLGGINGDCLGASVEITESLLLLALIAGAHVFTAPG
jgi:adenosylcobinamide-GDP ribazoletransferase